MNRIPKTIIHINFLPGELLFDARPIWTALRDATSNGRVPALSKMLEEELGGAAIHLGTRDYLMRAAFRELNASTKAIWHFVPTSLEVGSIPNTRVMRGQAVEHARDRVLLATDSVLHECRAFLDLVARFTYAMLTGIGKQPSAKQLLSTGQDVKLVDRNGRLRPHAFLLLLCDQLRVPTDWYLFLSSHRNLFTHQATPYCAVEEIGTAPPEFDLLVMRTNILDFRAANPKDYFRISDFRPVAKGLGQFASAVQHYLVSLLQ